MTDDRPGADDPRLDEEYVRVIAGDDAGDVVLVGVVHDHPASAYRVGSVVESRRPAVLALEVSPIALPMFQAYADDAETPPRSGGELSAAIQAADDARVVGIDGPSRRFATSLVRRLVDERPSQDTFRRVLDGLASVTKQALACRIAGAVAARTSFRVAVDDPVDHDCSPTDAPEVQARDESKQVRRVQHTLSVLDRPDWIRVRDETREACMAGRLTDLRAEGDVVAVVGMGHLDAVAEHLRTDGQAGH